MSKYNEFEPKKQYDFPGKDISMISGLHLPNDETNFVITDDSRKTTKFNNKESVSLNLSDLNISLKQTDVKTKY